MPPVAENVRLYFLDKPLFDQNTYVGRFKQMWYICGPGSWDTIFISQAEIRRCVCAVSAYRTLPREKELEQKKVKELLWAKHVCDVVLHPDTKEPIPFPFRMSMHVPMNTILLMGMLSAVRMRQHIVAQTCNQTFNAFQFYFNGNKSNQVATSTLAAATIAAVGGATGAVFYMDKWVERLKKQKSPTQRIARLCLPLICAASAKPFQIGNMRSDELLYGINVYDQEKTQCFGRSVIAGYAAVFLTVLTRVAYLFQPMIFPPLLRRYIEQKQYPILRRNPSLLAVVNITVVCASSAIATPMCIALFQQTSSLPVNLLENHIREKVYKSYSTSREDFPGKNDDAIYRAYFNKGL